MIYFNLRMKNNKITIERDKNKHKIYQVFIYIAF